MRVLSFLILFLFSAAPAWAAPVGTAKGKFTANDATAEIRHAVAVPWTNKDDGRQGVKVVLSDVPISDDAVSRDGEGFDPGDKPGQVHAIEYILYPEEGADSGTLYHPGLEGYSLITGSTTGSYKFTSEVMDANTVAGRLYMEEPHDFFGRVYFYDVTFRAPISRTVDAAGGPPAGTAQGTWTVKGQVTSLRYAYAVARRNFEDEPEKIYVVLSEAEIPSEKLLGQMGLRELMRAGNFRALEFELDPKKGIESSELYHEGFQHGSISSSGSSTFLMRVFDAKTVAGRVFMTKPSDFFDVLYHFSGAFRANIVRKPPPTFVGAAAAASAPGLAVAAFMRAARLKNKLAMKKLITSEMAADLDGPQGAEFLKFLSMMFEPGSKVVAVYQTGDRAEVVVMAKGKGSKSSQKIPVKLIEGKWTLTKE